MRGKSKAARTLASATRLKGGHKDVDKVKFENSMGGKEASRIFWGRGNLFIILFWQLNYF